MNADELRDKSDDQLRKLEEQLNDELFNLKMQHHTGQLQATSELKKTRRDIARVKTVLRERELEDDQEDS